MKMVTWSVNGSDDYEEADKAGNAITLIDDTTEFCVTTGDVGIVNQLNVGLSIPVEMFFRWHTIHKADSYVLSLVDHNNVEKFSYDRENNTWVVVTPPDVFKNVNVTHLLACIADIEKWCGEAYQPTDEVGTAIEEIKGIANGRWDGDKTKQGV